MRIAWGMRVNDLEKKKEKKKKEKRDVEREDK
jgi:hypothetical protein